MEQETDGADKPAKPTAPKVKEEAPAPAPPPEVGGRDGPEPTRYGDWEVNGICTDF
jgi:hypothetical protein